MMFIVRLILFICLSNIGFIFAQQNYYDPNNPNSPNYNPYNSTQFNNTQSKSDSLANPEDTTTTYKVKKKWSWKKNPTVATLASTFLPGAGQIYNKKYWKAPIIWALLGISSYFAWVNHNRYLDYRTGFFYVSGFQEDKNGEVIPFKNYEERAEKYNQLMDNSYGFPGIVVKNQMPDFFDKENSSDSTRTGSNLAFIRDQSRQTRDYMGLGLILVYVLNIVDAAVDAHFTDFDVSDKLSLKIEPKFISPLNTPQYGLAMTLTFRENRKKNAQDLKKNNF